MVRGADCREWDRRAFLAGLLAVTAACGRGSDEASRTTTTTSTTVSTTSSPPTTRDPVSTTTSEATSTTASDEPPTTTEPATTTTEPDPDQPAGPAGFVCRSAWGARAPKPGGRRHTISRLTVHHSAVVLGAGDDPTQHLRNYQSWHQADNGWIDIAYHVAVDRAGTAYMLRDHALAGDTSTSYDPAGHFLVLAIGNFDAQQPSEAQLDGVARVLAWGAATYGAALSTITGHRDHAATACPGDALYRHLGGLASRAESMAAGSLGLTGC